MTPWNMPQKAKPGKPAPHSATWLHPGATSAGNPPAGAGGWPASRFGHVFSNRHGTRRDPRSGSPRKSWKETTGRSRRYRRRNRLPVPRTAQPSDANIRRESRLCLRIARSCAGISPDFPRFPGVSGRYCRASPEQWTCAYIVPTGNSVYPRPRPDQRHPLPRK